MRVGSLFSGVGGFDLGLECAGMDIVWQVEADKWCRQVLRARWPGVNLYGDVNDVGPDQLSDVDLICGGFPCQDLSVAGNREGLDGERSGLWHEFLRIADSVAPRWVLIENVPGLLSSNDGEDFAVLLGGLTGFHPAVPDGGWEDGGYCEGPKRRAFWRVLDTQHFGPPQRRRRVFIVADSRARCGPEVLLEPESVPGDPAPRGEAGEGAAGESPTGVGVAGAGADTAASLNARDRKGPLPSRAIGTVAFNATQDPISEEEKNPALSDQGAAVYSESGRGWWTKGPARLRGQPGGMPQNVTWALQDTGRETKEQGGPKYRDDGKAFTLPSSHMEPGVLTPAVPRRLTPRECERLQGFPDDWTAEGVDADGEQTEISDTQRYKQMGNAVSVPVAAWIGARIVSQVIGRDNP